MLTEDKVTEIFYVADEFCKLFDSQMEKYVLKDTGKRKYHRDSRMSKLEYIELWIRNLHYSEFIELTLSYKL